MPHSSVTLGTIYSAFSGCPGGRPYILEQRFPPVSGCILIGIAPCAAGLRWRVRHKYFPEDKAAGHFICICYATGAPRFALVQAGLLGAGQPGCRRWGGLLTKIICCSDGGI